jgi:hypothetical protein
MPTGYRGFAGPRGSTTLIYGDCARAHDRRGCPPVQFLVWPVCSTPGPLHPGRLGDPVRRTRIRGAAAFLAFLFVGGMWELHTRHVMVRVFAGGREGRRVLAALRGLNPPSVRAGAGRALRPAPGALRGRLACQPAFSFLGRPIRPR